jgi:hypothetical protein
MRVQDQKVANQGLTYIAPFWKGNQLVGTSKKKAQRKSHDLENQDAS